MQPQTDFTGCQKDNLKVAFHIVRGYKEMDTSVFYVGLFGLLTNSLQVVAFQSLLIVK